MNLILKPSFIRFVLLWKKKYKLIIVFNIFYNLFCFRIFLRTKIFGVSLRFYLQIRTEMARNSYHPWKVIRSNIEYMYCTYTYQYMSYAIFQKQKTSLIWFFPLVFYVWHMIWILIYNLYTGTLLWRHQWIIFWLFFLSI